MNQNNERPVRALDEIGIAIYQTWSTSIKGIALVRLRTSFWLFLLISAVMISPVWIFGFKIYYNENNDNVLAYILFGTAAFLAVVILLSALYLHHLRRKIIYVLSNGEKMTGSFAELVMFAQKNCKKVIMPYRNICRYTDALGVRQKLKTKIQLGDGHYMSMLGVYRAGQLTMIYDLEKRIFLLLKPQ